MKVVELLLQGGTNSVLLLVVQVALILGLSRLLGLLFTRLRQPQVVGEMVAGIMLGPSLFGLLAPHAASLVFPASSVGYLNVLSQLGVICFLFLVGLELDPRLIRNRGHAALAISHVSIVAPFLLGGALAIYLYPRLFNDTPAMKFQSVALFMGASMSVTAFPVLARILTERGLHKTKVGAVSITCAAVDDVTAWCMLAFVVGIARAQGLKGGMTTAVLSVIYVSAMFFAVRPFLKRLQQTFERQQRLSQAMVGLIVVMVLVSAYLTEIIGIHALFGAFLLGAIMPKSGAFVKAILEKLEDFVVVVLLPIFFAYTGLRTHIGVLDNREMWFYCSLIILVACAGKFGGSTLAARACGIGWRESGAIGVLMNTRGLMELVIINVGRELGVITDAVFAMMVIMALVTTALTTPILHLVYPQRRMQEDQISDALGSFAILIPVSRPASGKSLVQLASTLIGPGEEDHRVLALTLRRPIDRDAYRAGIDAEQAPEANDSLKPLLEEAGRRKVPVTAITFTSRDFASDISRTARLRHANLILMGFHHPVYTSSILGGTVHRVLTGSDSDVAIYVDRNRTDGPPKNILVPYMGSKHDRLALELAGRMARHTNVAVTVLHVSPPGGNSDANKVHAKSATDRVFNDPTQPLPVTLRTVEGDSPVDLVVEQSKEFDLVIIGVAEEWGLESHLLGFRAERIAQEVTAPLLIVRKHGTFAAARGLPQSPKPAREAVAGGV